MSDLDQSTLGPTLPVRHRLSQALGSLIGHRFDHVLDGIQHGQLSLTWPDGHITIHGPRTDDPEWNVSVVLHDFTPLRQLMLHGEIGFAESYLQGHWSTDNLTRLFALIVRNEDSMGTPDSGTWLARSLNYLRHVLNNNSLRGSQRNIAFHYDLGNRFYALWLDPTMSYSSGIYHTSDDSLEQAQWNKIDRVIEMIDPAPSSRVLEIGCGWGAMAHALSERRECQITGISLSREQLDYAAEHHGHDPIAGSADGATEFRYQDYRDVDGQFEHIVSIEMFEAVGEKYWPTYFARLAELLKAGGTAVLQVITILESRFEVYKRSPDFIQRYIFPGGMLPTKTILGEQLEAAGLQLDCSEWFGASYARTLADWHERFDRQSRDVLAQGFDERFLRMWRYYLAYCEAGFLLGTTDVGLLRVRKL